MFAVLFAACTLISDAEVADKVGVGGRDPSVDDADADADSDADSDADGDTDTDGDSDADGDTDADSGSDTGHDTGVDPPPEGRWSGTKNISDVSDFSWVNQDAGTYTGGSLDWVSDVNGDGKDDVVLGSTGGAVRLFMTPFEAEMVVTDAYRAWTGGPTFGYPSTIVGDVDGDGSRDLSIGTYQGIVLLLGPLPSATTSAAVLVNHNQAEENPPVDVEGLGDLDSDGSDDLAISGVFSNVSKVYVWRGIPSAASSWAEADTQIRTVRPVQLGSADANADGVPDLLVGDGSPAQVWLVTGPLPGGTMELADVGTPTASDDPANYAGFCVGMGDTNGDGYDDVLVGAPLDDEGASDAGAVYLLPGASAGWPASLSGAQTKLVGRSTSAQIGGTFFSPGDTDADGFTDLVVAAATSDGNGENYVHYGPLAAGTAEAAVTADFVVSGEGGDQLGYAGVHTEGDADGDGFPDLLLAAGGRASNSGGANIILSMVEE